MVKDMKRGRESYRKSKIYKCTLSFRPRKEPSKYIAGQSPVLPSRLNRLALAVHIFIRRGIWKSVKITCSPNILIHISEAKRMVLKRIIAPKQSQLRRYMSGGNQNLRLIETYSPVESRREELDCYEYGRTCNYIGS